MATLLPHHPPEATAHCSNERRSLISRRMTAAEVVSHLIAHKCKDLSSIIDLSTFDDNPVSQGGFSDVYQGYLLDAARSQVAVKTLRISTLDPDPEHLKHAARELHTWSKCRHPNIVPLLGLTVFQGRIGMVSPWMGKGSLLRYLEKTPDANRHSLCVQICEGLSYLHRIGITHGDLKGGNVLVSERGIPALTDFGNSILADATMKLTQRDGQTSGAAVTLRWSAAELIAGTSPQTKAADVYALGMTILETITGKWPYHGKSDTTVMFLVVMKKETPERPESIPSGHVEADKLWGLLLRSWSYEPEARPSVIEVANIMKSLRISIPISRHMSLIEVMQQLELHGCNNMTNLLQLTKCSKTPFSRRGSHGIYRGTLVDGTKVAIKRLDILDDVHDRKSIKRCAHEIYTLSRCNHPNILQLIGFAEYHGRLTVVSPWFGNRDLNFFISRGSQAKADWCSLPVQIAAGVAYLHKEGIVHGNIKGSNVLVADDHTAKLTGFGNVTPDNHPLQFTATTSNPNVGLRWAAPEIIEETTGPTAQADVYSLGMTILECITGTVPYAQVHDQIAVLQMIIRNIHPGRPVEQIPNNEHGDRLWALLTKCWSRDTAMRPTATEVEKEMSTITPEGLTAAGG